MDLKPFDKALKRVPAIVVGSLASGRRRVTGLGTIADHPDPSGLCWEIGSITKVFTGLLLAEMAQRGEVRLDDPIGKWAPAEVTRRLPPVDQQPTLQDLATHTAGLPRLPFAWVRRIKRDPNPYSHLTDQDVWAALGPRTRRPHRARSRYSNFGMGLLGHLLARAAGTTYETALTRRVLEPLGLTSTGTDGCDGREPVPGFSKGKPTPPWTFGAVPGAGALRSTVTDMLDFAAATIDPPAGLVGEALDLARRPAHRNRLGIGGMGLGWQLRASRRPGSVVWHNGGTYGGASFIAVDPEKRRALVAFGNAGPRFLSPLDGPSWRAFDSLCPDSTRTP